MRFLKRFKLPFLLVSLVLILVMIIPMVVFAQTYPDVDGHYYTCTGNYKVYNMDNGLIATYKGLGFWIGDQTDNIVSGEIDLYQASTIRGTYLTGGTGKIKAIHLREGINTVTVTSFGTHLLTLPMGVEGFAASGTANVTGSFLELETGGIRDIPTTSNGEFTLFLSRNYTTVGEFTGIIGKGVKPRFQLIGTQTYAVLTDDTGTATGSPVTCIPSTTTIYVTSNGSFYVDVPHGMVGSVSSGTATVTDGPVTLPGGEETQFSTGATTGTVTITLRVVIGYNISGYLGLDRFGEVSYMKGRIDGFIILNNESWEVLQFNSTFKARYNPGD